jgi:hypothetical protein
MTSQVTAKATRAQSARWPHHHDRPHRPGRPSVGKGSALPLRHISGVQFKPAAADQRLHRVTVPAGSRPSPAPARRRSTPSKTRTRSCSPASSRVILELRDAINSALYRSVDDQPAEAVGRLG